MGEGMEDDDDSGDGKRKGAVRKDGKPKKRWKKRTVFGRKKRWRPPAEQVARQMAFWHKFKKEDKEQSMNLENESTAHYSPFGEKKTASSSSNAQSG